MVILKRFGEGSNGLLTIKCNLIHLCTSLGVGTSGDGETSFPSVCVMSPTRALAKQIHEEAKKFSFNTPIKAVVVYGGVSVHHHIDMLRKGCHIVVATPGRLDDFIKRGMSCLRIYNPLKTI